jgi:PAS domain-containing protein
MRVIMPDRRVRWVRSQLMPIMGAVGTPLTAVGVCTDITHDRETQHFLRLTANRFHALTRTSPSVYWTLTLDGRHAVILNSSAPDRKQGVDLRTLMDENSRREFDETCATFLPIRNPFKLTVHLRAEDGSFRRHWSRAMPIINEKGDVQEWLGVSQDPIAARDIWMKRDAAHRITGAQMRAARAIIRWSVAELAAAAGVSPAVIRRLEENDGASPAEEAHEAIQGALLRAGVELTHDCDGKPGVRPR